MKKYFILCAVFAAVIAVVKIRENNRYLEIKGECESLRRQVELGKQQVANLNQIINDIQATSGSPSDTSENKEMFSPDNLNKSYDDVDGVTWYKNKYFAHYNNSNLLSIYIGQRKEGAPWLRLIMSYCGDDWIFFDRAVISYDGNSFDVPFDEYKEKKSDNSGSECWEWIDVPVSDAMLAFLRKMANGKTLKMRLAGKYVKTRVLTPSEVDAIKDVLAGYDALMNDYRTN